MILMKRDADKFLTKKKFADTRPARERLKEYAIEFADLVRSGATKDQLRNGANGKHGLTHINEVFMMLPDGVSKAEFRIKE